MNKYISAICKKAKDSSHSSSRYNTRIKNNTLKSLISEIKNNVRSITSSNEKDIKSASHKNLEKVLLIGLILNTSRIKNMTDGLEKIIEIPDTVYRVSKRSSLSVAYIPLK